MFSLSQELALNQSVASLISSPSIFVPPLVVQPLPKLINSRIEWYDNNNPCPRGKTQYGLLLDVDYSKYRWNFNFFDRDEGVSFIQNGFKDELFNDDHQQTIYRMFKSYKMIHTFLDVSMTHAKLNVLSGLKHPVTGKPSYKFVDEFRVWAMIIRNSFTPTAWLFYGDETYQFDNYGWAKPMTSSNKQMKWVQKIR